MKYYNNIKSLLCGSLLLLAVGTFMSCTDWLDKDPDSIVAEDEAFKNFRNFQGYIEEIYSLIPSKETVNYCTAWNFGDDAVHNPEGYAHMDHQVDLGNYRNWYTNNQCWLNGAWSSLWRNSWYCIRKCNMGIENIGSLIGTDEERDLLLGQMYFFRAWWHFELMCYFGGLPYIDQSFVDGHIPELPRLSFFPNFPVFLSRNVQTVVLKILKEPPNFFLWIQRSGMRRLSLGTTTLLTITSCVSISSWHSAT